MGIGASRDSLISMEEQIVMTPTVKTDQFTAILLERRVVDPEDAIGNPNIHVAGGHHTGIIINNEQPNPGDGYPAGGGGGGGDAYNFEESPHANSQFKVFLVSSSTRDGFWEGRKLSFWFEDDKVPQAERVAYGHQFFLEVVGGDENHPEFPRDYVGFITKVLKLMQLRYDGVKRIKIEFERLEETDGFGKRDGLMERQLLEMIECAYPNPLSIQEIARRGYSSEEHVRCLISILQSKNLIKSLDGDGEKALFTRIVLNDLNIRVVNQMPHLIQSKQPTVAIITSHFFEKLAVDAMIENHETFVRHGGVGESNVFTLGNIGSHRVVSTKLPSVSEGNNRNNREAMISSGNRTTRLLGTFQNVDYVILIGICGGVLRNNVRIGDVVVSSPSELQDYAYLHCKRKGNDLEVRRWTPSSLSLQKIAQELQREEGWEDEWASVAKKGLDILSEQQHEEQGYYNFSRVRISDSERKIERKVHLGPIASGKEVTRDDSIRQDLVAKLNVLAFDSEESDCVIESIIGNRRNSFAIISGVADYKDGSSGRKETQPHAALLAASFAKLVIAKIDSIAEP